jgi:hypothetical protein
MQKVDGETGGGAMTHVECPRVSVCEMFQLFSSVGFEEVWKKSFCFGKFPQCRRYQLFLGHHYVAPNLLPNGEHFPMPKPK